MTKWTASYDMPSLKYLIVDDGKPASERRIIATVPKFGSDLDQIFVASLIQKAPEMRELLLEANEAYTHDEELGSEFFRRVRKLLRDLDLPVFENPKTAKDPQGGAGGSVMKVWSGSVNPTTIKSSGGTGGNVLGSLGGKVYFHDRDREALLEVEKRARVFVQNQNVSTLNDLANALRRLDEARTPPTQEIAKRIVGEDLSITPDVRAALVSKVKKALDEERERPR